VGINQQRLVSNALHIGRQAEGIRKTDVKPAEHHENSDMVDLSETSKKGREAGENTGIAGRQGAKETGADDKTDSTKNQKELLIEGEHKNPESAEKPMNGKASGQTTGTALIPTGEPALPPGVSIVNDHTGTGLPEEQPMYIMNAPGAASSGNPGTIPPGAQAPGGQAPPPGGSSTSYTDAATKAKEAQEDAQKAQSIYAEMASSRQKWLMQMWQIIQDTQTAIIQMMQEAALRRTKMMDTCAAKWAACLGGYDLK
jgi:hypothetical protein